MPVSTGNRAVSRDTLHNTNMHQVGCCPSALESQLGAVMAEFTHVGNALMNDSNTPTDHHVITQRAYATDEHLAVRIRTHELYTRPEIDFPAWVLDKIPWRGDERVLDVGAGSGNYFDLVQARVPHGETSDAG